MITSVVALVGSFAVIGIVVAGALAGLFEVVRTDGLRSRSAFRALIACGVAGTFSIVWYAFVLLPIIPTEALRQFWTFAYLGTGDLVHARQLFTWMFQSAFGVPYWAGTIVLIAATVVVAIRRPAHAILFGLPVVIAIGASVANQAPFGSGRTDTWFYAPMIFMVISALDIGLERLDRRRGERDPKAIGSAARRGGAAIVGIAVAMVILFAVRGYPGGSSAYGGYAFRTQSNGVPLING